MKQKLRERLADVEYEVAKEKNKIISLKEQVESRLKQKEEIEKYKFKWENTYQLGLEQTELEIAIREATIAKLVNEIKFLRLDLDGVTA
jgi:hypothetical protein